MHKQFVIDTNGIMKLVNQFANNTQWDKFGEHMNDFVREVAKEAKTETTSFVPSTDVAENTEAYFVHIELPGMAKSDVSLTLSEENVLTVSGTKTRVEQEGLTFSRSERTNGEFKRSLRFDEIINDSAITAEFRDGVLSITLPKLQPAKPKEIAITIG
jgi:HSP20 family protein